MKTQITNPQIKLESNALLSNHSISREVLAFGYPQGIEGKILELVRYTIPSGVVLPPHSHPGMQIEQIELGILTYTVIKGTAKVIRANKQTQLLQAGQTTYLYSGDSLTEPAGMIHYAKNETNSPIILYSSSLFEVNQPKAITVVPGSATENCGIANQIIPSP
ncbi:MAG: cupin domain-containing protein [Cyanobacteria bacterium P01_G01_bin.67]